MTTAPARRRKTARVAPRKTGKRAAPNINDDRWFLPYSYFQLFAPTAAGIEVNEESAKRFSAVFACVKIISETLASIPILAYRRLPNGGKERVTKERVYRLLKLRPNRWQTSFLFRQFLFAHTLTWGNGYAEIVRGPDGAVAEMYPLHPSLVTPLMTDAGELFYKVREQKTGRERVLLKRDMFHLVGITDDGVTGYSPIAAMREGIGLGLAAETFGASFFGNGATPAAVIEYPGHIDPKAREDFKAKIDDLYKGARKAGKVAVLSDGMTWKPIGIPVKDAQYIELRRFQIEEIARIYRVPLYKLQDHTHSTFSNIEHLSIDWVSDCLYPWARRFEDTVQRDLLNAETDLDTYTDDIFVEFLFEGLLRGDIQSRYAAYATGRNWGWLSINDVRERENMNPIGPEGDVYLTPLNMVPAGQEGAEPPPSQPQDNQPQGGTNDGQEEDPTEAETNNRAGGPKGRGDQDGHQAATQKAEVREHFKGPFRCSWERVIRKEVGCIRNAAKKREGEQFDAWLAGFCTEHREFTTECLRQICLAYAGLIGARDVESHLDGVVERYLDEVKDRVDKWRHAPALGYVRDVAVSCDDWTDRLLNCEERGQ